MLYRFQIQVSDIDSNAYKTLDLRLAQHPSETSAFLLTRLIAFALNEQEFLEFSPSGLSDPDAPAISATLPSGEIRLWIEIGNPSARKLHRATKASKQVIVYTYKDPEPLLKEIREGKVFRSEGIQIYALESKFLERLAELMERKNTWDLILQEGTLTVNVGDKTEAGDLQKYSV